MPATQTGLVVSEAQHAGDPPGLATRGTANFDGLEPRPRMRAEMVMFTANRDQATAADEVQATGRVRPRAWMAVLTLLSALPSSCRSSLSLQVRGCRLMCRDGLIRLPQILHDQAEVV